MTRARKLAFALALALSLSPTLLFAFLGFHSRPMSDDYCHMRVGLDLGAWQGMLHWRQTWNGSYSDYFLHGLTAPLGRSVTSVAPAAIISLWLAGLAWINFRCLTWLNAAGWRRAMALGLASATVGASINAFFSLESIYWHAAATRYALPLALLTLYAGLTLEYASRRRSHRWSALALAAAFLLCFFAGGLSELHLTFQTAAMTLVLLSVVALVPKPARKPSLQMLSSGWLATLASLAVQLSAPGIGIRARKIATVTAPPNRDPLHMLSRSFDEAFQYLADDRSFAAFVMLLSASLFLMLAFYQPAERRRSRSPIPLARSPLLLGLLVQLLCLPLLWPHASDNPQFLGRYSAGYALALLVNATLVICASALLLGQARINRRLRAGSASGFAVPGVAVGVIILLFAMTQLRSVHWRAATYFFISCLLMLTMLSWLLALGLTRSEGRRLWLNIPCCALIAIGGEYCHYAAAIAYLRLPAAACPGRRAPFDCAARLDLGGASGL